MLDESDDSLRVEYHEGHEHPDGDTPPAPVPGPVHAMPPLGFSELAPYLLPLLKSPVDLIPLHKGFSGPLAQVYPLSRLSLAETGLLEMTAAAIVL